MRHFKAPVFYLLLSWIVAAFLTLHGLAEGTYPPDTYIPTYSEYEMHKGVYDDPRPVLNEYGPKQILLSELYAKLTYDVDKMKNLWAEVVGFRSPELVGKIAPEIRPGKYTYEDLEEHPGLKELMWPDLYSRIKPACAPYSGNIAEFEIIPTRQYFWALPIAEATKQNMGKTKSDEQGYYIPETWEGGYPYPQPSGKHKAQQIIYNVDKRYLAWEGNYYQIGWIQGFNKNLKRDFNGIYEILYKRLAGRTQLAPYGFLDERAEKRGEFKQWLLTFRAPRDVAGVVQSGLFFLDPEKSDQLMIYIPSLRRVRKLSTTDTQDPVMGQDIIYDDNEGFMQKLSSVRYPYEYELLDEREFLVPGYTLDGSEYFRSEGIELVNTKFERRPIYVVKMKQLDPNYVYSERIFFVDKETFNFFHIENYDYKGRLYRTYDRNYSFFSEMGMFSWCGGIAVMRDYIDVHSTVSMDGIQIPADFERRKLSLEGMLRRGK